MQTSMVRQSHGIVCVRISLVPRLSRLRLERAWERGYVKIWPSLISNFPFGKIPEINDRKLGRGPS